MFESVGEGTKSQSLNARNGFVGRGTVRQHAGQFDNFRQPAAIVLTFIFNGEFHEITTSQSLSRRRKRSPTSELIDNALIPVLSCCVLIISQLQNFLTRFWW